MKVCKGLATEAAVGLMTGTGETSRMKTDTNDCCGYRFPSEIINHLYLH